jgi:Tol biopolymer transport system component
MPELREVFEMTVKQMGEPDLDSWREQENRQRKANRNRKLGAIAAAAVLVGAGVVLGISMLRSNEVQPGGSGPNSTITPKEAEQQTLSIVDVGSGAETTLTVPSTASGFDVSLDGSMAAYTDVDENGDAQVFVMDIDGSHARQLTTGEGDVGTFVGLPGVGTASDLDWSPDGSMIAYQRETSDGHQIFTVRVSDGVSTRVTNEPQGAVVPSWAPDGGSIVFSTPNPSVNHYSALSVDLTTGQTREIVPDGSTPELSPDGAWIAFNSWLKAPDIRLILANSDGSERRVIARFNGDDGYEEWSPDSTQIAFVADIDENGFGTHVYDLATGETRFVSGGTIETWIDNDRILVS